MRSSAGSTPAVLADHDLGIRSGAYEAGALHKAPRLPSVAENRISHGGILAPGGGVLKHGENGRGIKSRWYPHTLSKRILNIKTVREKVTFVNGDSIETIEEYAHQKAAVFFIDPPYTAGRNGKRAGTRLYNHNELDHEELFAQTAKIQGDFLMTYDNADEVIQMAMRHGFATTTISMKNTHHATMQELMIGRDLSSFSS
jgi:DNA adenine methylase